MVFLSRLSDGIKLFLALSEIEAQEKKIILEKNKILFHTYDFVASKIHTCNKSTKLRNNFHMTPENGIV